MHPASQFGSKTASLMVAILLVGTAGAQGAEPAAPATVPRVYKTIIYNGSVPTVSYIVQGGSPHLEALCQTLEYTENEMTLTKELQKLRLGIVTTSKPIWSKLRRHGFGPVGAPGYAACGFPPYSTLKGALIPGLAQEATPSAAFELINLREQVQTELQVEQAKATGVVHGGPPAG